ncbi:MAG: hypothetical protein J1E38_06100 [Paramuribaculum sp.]|nr:hypothetical protein [Paramuribaculum sp.]
MKYAKKILTVSLLLLFCATGCKKNSIDPTSDPQLNASEIINKYSPAEAGEIVVKWMSERGLSDREYARALTREIFSKYDSIGYDSSREFLYAIDSIQDLLPKEKLAKVYVIATNPWRLGKVLREENADENFVKLIESEYESDTASLTYFRQSYYLQDK